MGYFTVKVEFNGEAKDLVLYVLKKRGSSLLGRKFLKSFDLTLAKVDKTQVKHLAGDDVSQLKKQFKALFKEELGCYKYSFATTER